MGKFSVEFQTRSGRSSSKHTQTSRGTALVPGAQAGSKFQFSYNDGPASNAQFSSLWWSDLAVGSLPRKASGDEEEVRSNLCNISKGKSRGGEKLISAPDQQELSQLEAAVLSLQHNPSRKHLSWEVILSLRRSLKSAGSTFPELPVSISSSCATPRYRSSGQPLGGK